MANKLNIQKNSSKVEDLDGASVVSNETKKEQSPSKHGQEALSDLRDAGLKEHAHGTDDGLNLKDRIEGSNKEEHSRSELVADVHNDNRHNLVEDSNRLVKAINQAAINDSREIAQGNPDINEQERSELLKKGKKRKSRKKRKGSKKTQIDRMGEIAHVEQELEEDLEDAFDAAAGGGLEVSRSIVEELLDLVQEQNLYLMANGNLSDQEEFFRLIKDHLEHSEGLFDEEEKQHIAEHVQELVNRAQGPRVASPQIFSTEKQCLSDKAKDLAAKKAYCLVLAEAMAHDLDARQAYDTAAIDREIISFLDRHPEHAVKLGKLIDFEIGRYQELIQQDLARLSEAVEVLEQGLSEKDSDKIMSALRFVGSDLLPFVYENYEQRHNNNLDTVLAGVLSELELQYLGLLKKGEALLVEGDICVKAMELGGDRIDEQIKQWEERGSASRDLFNKHLHEATGKSFSKHLGKHGSSSQLEKCEKIADQDKNFKPLIEIKNNIERYRIDISPEDLLDLLSGREVEEKPKVQSTVALELIEVLAAVDYQERQRLARKYKSIYKAELLHLVDNQASQAQLLYIKALLNEDEAVALAASLECAFEGPYAEIAIAEKLTGLSRAQRLEVEANYQKLFSKNFQKTLAAYYEVHSLDSAPRKAAFDKLHIGQALSHHEALDLIKEHTIELARQRGAELAAASEDIVTINRLGVQLRNLQAAACLLCESNTSAGLAIEVIAQETENQERAKEIALKAWRNAAQMRHDQGASDDHSLCQATIEAYQEYLQKQNDFLVVHKDFSKNLALYFQQSVQRVEDVILDARKRASNIYTYMEQKDLRWSKIKPYLLDENGNKLSGETLKYIHEFYKDIAREDLKSALEDNYYFSSEREALDLVRIETDSYLEVSEPAEFNFEQCFRSSDQEALLALALAQDSKNLQNALLLKANLENKDLIPILRAVFQNTNSKAEREQVLTTYEKCFSSKFLKDVELQRGHDGVNIGTPQKPNIVGSTLDTVVAFINHGKLNDLQIRNHLIRRIQEIGLERAILMSQWPARNERALRKIDDEIYAMQSTFAAYYSRYRGLCRTHFDSIKEIENNARKKLVLLRIRKGAYDLQFATIHEQKEIEEIQGIELDGYIEANTDLIQDKAFEHELLQAKEHGLNQASEEFASINKAVAKIYEEMDAFFDTDENSVYQELSKFNSKQFKLFDEAYKEKYKISFLDHLRSELSDEEYHYAYSLHCGLRLDALAAELCICINDAKLDRAVGVFAKLQADEKEEFRKIFEERYADEEFGKGFVLEDCLADEFSGDELLIATAAWNNVSLQTGKEVDLEALKRSQVELSCMRAHLALEDEDVEALAPILEALVDENGDLDLELLSEFETVFAKTYPESSLREMVQKCLDRVEQAWILALLDGDKVAADANKLRYARLDSNEDLIWDVLSPMETISRIHQLEQMGPEAAVELEALREKYREHLRSVESLYNEKFRWEKLKTALRREMGLRKYEVARTILDTGRVYKSDILRRAMGGSFDGTKEDLIKNIMLTGLTKQQVRALEEEYGKRWGRDLADDLESELSGDDWFDVEEALRGVPETAEEAYAALCRRHDYERGGADWIVDVFTNDGELFDVEFAKAKKEYERLAREKRLDSEEARRRMMAFYERNMVQADTFRAEKNAWADVVTDMGTLGVVVFTSVVTGGSAFYVFLAITAYRAASKLAFKGFSGYGMEEAALDVGMAALDAATMKLGEAIDVATRGINARIVGRLAAKRTGKVVTSGSTKLAQETGERVAVEGVEELAERCVYSSFKEYGEKIIEDHMVLRVASGVSGGVADGVVSGAAVGAISEGLVVENWENGFWEGLQHVSNATWQYAKMGVLFGAAFGGGFSIRKKRALTTKSASDGPAAAAAANGSIPRAIVRAIDKTVETRLDDILKDAGHKAQDIAESFDPKITSNYTKQIEGITNSKCAKAAIKIAKNTAETVKELFEKAPNSAGFKVKAEELAAVNLDLAVAKAERWLQLKQAGMELLKTPLGQVRSKLNTAWDCIKKSYKANGEVGTLKQKNADLIEDLANRKWRINRKRELREQNQQLVKDLAKFENSAAKWKDTLWETLLKKTRTRCEEFEKLTAAQVDAESAVVEGRGLMRRGWSELTSFRLRDGVKNIVSGFVRTLDGPLGGGVAARKEFSRLNAEIDIDFKLHQKREGINAQASVIKNRVDDLAKFKKTVEEYLDVEQKAFSAKSLIRTGWQELSTSLPQLLVRTGHNLSSANIKGFLGDGLADIGQAFSGFGKCFRGLGEYVNSHHIYGHGARSDYSVELIKIERQNVRQRYLNGIQDSIATKDVTPQAQERGRKFEYLNINEKAAECAARRYEGWQNTKRILNDLVHLRLRRAKLGVEIIPNLLKTIDNEFLRGAWIKKKVDVFQDAIESEAYLKKQDAEYCKKFDKESNLDSVQEQKINSVASIKEGFDDLKHFRLGGLSKLYSGMRGSLSKYQGATKRARVDQIAYDAKCNFRKGWQELKHAHLFSGSYKILRGALGYVNAHHIAGYGVRREFQILENIFDKKDLRVKKVKEGKERLLCEIKKLDGCKEIKLSDIEKGLPDGLRAKLSEQAIAVFDSAIEALNKSAKGERRALSIRQKLGQGLNDLAHFRLDKVKLGSDILVNAGQMLLGRVKGWSQFKFNRLVDEFESFVWAQGLHDARKARYEGLSAAKGVDEAAYKKCCDSLEETAQLKMESEQRSRLAGTRLVNGISGCLALRPQALIDLCSGVFGKVRNSSHTGGFSSNVDFDWYRRSLANLSWQTPDRVRVEADIAKRATEGKIDPATTKKETELIAEYEQVVRTAKEGLNRIRKGFSEVLHGRLDRVKFGGDILDGVSQVFDSYFGDGAGTRSLYASLRDNAEIRSFERSADKSRTTSKKESKKGDSSTTDKSSSTDDVTSDYTKRVKESRETTHRLFQGFRSFVRGRIVKGTRDVFASAISYIDNRVGSGFKARRDFRNKRAAEILQAEAVKYRNMLDISHATDKVVQTIDAKVANWKARKEAISQIRRGFSDVLFFRWNRTAEIFGGMFDYLRFNPIRSHIRETNRIYDFAALGDRLVRQAKEAGFFEEASAAGAAAQAGRSYSNEGSEPDVAKINAEAERRRSQFRLLNEASKDLPEGTNIRKHTEENARRFLNEAVDLELDGLGRHQSPQVSAGMDQIRQLKNEGILRGEAHGAWAFGKQGDPVNVSDSRPTIKTEQKNQTWETSAAPKLDEDTRHLRALPKDEEVYRSRIDEMEFDQRTKAGKEAIDGETDNHNFKEEEELRVREEDESQRRKKTEEDETQKRRRRDEDDDGTIKRRKHKKKKSKRRRRMRPFLMPGSKKMKPGMVATVKNNWDEIYSDYKIAQLDNETNKTFSAARKIWRKIRKFFSSHEEEDVVRTEER